MVYVRGGTIEASDYNNFVGANTTGAYPSSASATEKVGAMYGVGWASIGYGQTALPIGLVNPTDTISNTEWLNLRNMLSVIRQHQLGGSLSGLVPPATAFDLGDTIIAHDGITDVDNIVGEIATAHASRLTTNGARSTFNPGFPSPTRGSSWSGTINAVTRINFANGDEIRYFFNAGGRIRMRIVHPAGTTQDDNWRNAVLNRLGFMYFGATNTTTSGTLGLSSSVGFWDVNGSPGVFFDAIPTTNIGTGSYAANDVRVEARVLTGVGGSNGSTGSQLQFRVTLRDQHANTFFDSVRSGTRLDTTYDQYTGVLNNPLYAPTGLTIDNNF